MEDADTPRLAKALHRRRNGNSDSPSSPRSLTENGSSRRSANLRLPQLLDQRALSEELNVTSAAAEKIMRQVPKVHFPGLRKVYVKREDVIRVVEEATSL